MVGVILLIVWYVLLWWRPSLWWSLHEGTQGLSRKLVICTYQTYCWFSFVSIVCLCCEPILWWVLAHKMGYLLWVMWHDCTTARLHRHVRVVREEIYGMCVTNVKSFLEAKRGVGVHTRYVEYYHNRAGRSKFGRVNPASVEGLIPQGWEFFIWFNFCDGDLACEGHYTGVHRFFLRKLIVCTYWL